METKKWSTKKKVLVSILVILCAAIIAGVLYMFFKPDPLPQVIIKNHISKHRKGDKGFDNPDS